MFKEGDKVYYTFGKRIGSVTGEKRPFRNSFQWEIKFGEREFLFLRQEHLEPYDQGEKPWDRLLDGRLGNATDLQKYLSSIRLSGRLSNIFYSMRTGTAQFYPHQFKPVLKFIESINGSLLIADEVGLGKTIEALYIWKELVARKEAKKLLVIPPAALRTKWKDDIENFFGISAEIVNIKELYDQIVEAALPSHRNEEKVWIVSLQGIRYKPVTDIDENDRTPKAQFFKLLSEVENNDFFDLVIIDEAHYLRNSETASFKTAEFIRNYCKNMVLLSATPIQTSSDNLFNLLRLLSPEEYYDRTTFGEMLNKNSALVELSNDIRNIDKVNDTDLEYDIERIRSIDSDKYHSIIELFNSNKNILRSDPALQIKMINILNNYYFYNQCFTRTRKRDTTIESAIRDPYWHRFQLNKAEIEIYNRVKRYLESMGRGRRPVEVFTLITRLRQLTSSIPAALMYWKENDSIPESVWSNITPDSEENDYDDDSHENQFFTLGDDISEISEKIDINSIVKNDSKYDGLRLILSKISPTEKIIIFSFYRYTVKYLCDRLNRDGIKSIKLWGGITSKESKEEKQDILRTFEEDTSIRILVSTEVGSEGIDLQFSGFEVNYDLPWNPMRLEQRIGRIDRIGQTHKKITIYNLSCGDSIEDSVMERLYERINIFTTSIGDIEQIIGEKINRLSIDLFNPDLTEQQQNEKIERVLKAIENEKQQKEKLEERAGVLNTEFQEAIMKNIYISDKNKRYITREELFIFIMNSLYNSFPQSEIRNKTDSSFSLSLDNKAYQEFQMFVKQNNIKYSTTIRPQKQILCNFDPNSEKRFRRIHPHEFIDSSHPIIKWLADYENKNIKYTGCAGLHFPDCNEIKPGLYLFLIQEWVNEGYRKADELHFIFFSLDGNEFIEEDMAEGIFMKYILTCKDLPESMFVYQKYKEKIIKSKHLIIEKMLKYYEEYIINFEEQHKITILQQKEYSTILFNRLSRELNNLIEKYEYENRAETVIKGKRTRLDNLKRAHEQELFELNEKSSNIKENMKEIAIGLMLAGEYND